VRREARDVNRIRLPAFGLIGKNIETNFNFTDKEDKDETILAAEV
jgi:hypothetical protein